MERPIQSRRQNTSWGLLAQTCQRQGKGKVRNTAIPSNQLKRYIARSQNIPAKSDDEYASESDGDDDQGPPIDTNSPVLSDADIILYADSKDDKGISGVQIPGHTSSSDETIEIELEQTPGHTSSCDSDETIEMDFREIPGHTAHGYTMIAAEILATLAAGGDPDWLPDLILPEEEPEESLLEMLVALSEEAMLKFLMIRVQKQVQMLKFLGVQMYQFLDIQASSHL